MPSRPVEITLSPEELGRVRLSVSASDGGIVVNVVAERPETLDLLRRHIDQLGQEFQALGYADIGFSFAAGSDSQTDQDNSAAADAAPVPDAETGEGTVQAAQVHIATGQTSGLDLRL